MPSNNSRLGRYRALPDAAYDPRVTDLSGSFNGPPGAGPFAPGGAAAAISGQTSGRRYYNRNITNQLTVQLVANQTLRLLPFNDRRSGLLIQNQDAAAGLNYSLGQDKGFRGVLIAAGGAQLFDFTTPPDTLYLIASANILVAVVEITRRD